MGTTVRFKICTLWESGLPSVKDNHRVFRWPWGVRLANLENLITQPEATSLVQTKVEIHRRGIVFAGV